MGLATAVDELLCRHPPVLTFRHTLPPGPLHLAAPPRRLVSNFIDGLKSLPVHVVSYA